MKTRILIITLILLVAVAASAYAQNADAQPQAQARPIVAKIVQALGLTKDQATKIHDIVVKLHEDVAGVVKSSATEDDKKAQVKDLRTKAVAAIMALLTPEQQDKAKKMHLGEMIMAPRLAAERMGILFALSKIDLSDEQKASVKSIAEESKAAAKAIQDDTSLNQDAKQAKMKDLRKSTEVKVMAVLTPEQQQKLKDIIAKERQAGRGRRGAK